jgi:hypothetical protein
MTAETRSVDSQGNKVIARRKCDAFVCSQCNARFPVTHPRRANLHACTPVSVPQSAQKINSTNPGGAESKKNGPLQYCGSSIALRGRCDILHPWRGDKLTTIGRYHRSGGPFHPSTPLSGDRPRTSHGNMPLPQPNTRSLQHRTPLQKHEKSHFVSI